MVDVWHRYPSPKVLGHAMVKDVLQGNVVIQEKIDGCVTPETPILMVDMSYKPASKLKPGDKVVGFDEELKNTRLRTSTVTVSTPIEKECYKITLSDGRQITASYDHPWVKRYTTSNNSKVYITTEKLTVGTNLVALPYWDEDKSWDSGYIAGLFDGEGSLVRSGNSRVLSVYQRSGTVLTNLIKLLTKYNFNFSLDVRRRKEHYQEVGSLVLRGGSWTEILRFLGIYRPKRLIEDVKKIWEGTKLNYVPSVVVTNIEKIGKTVVQGLSTTTKTYTAYGLLCHNSQFSFGNIDGQLKIRSRGKEIDLDAPEKLFNKGIEYVKSLFADGKLKLNYMYSGEYLQKPKHNTLCYDRAPKNNIILFDIRYDNEHYVDTQTLQEEAALLELEAVPTYFTGRGEEIASDKLQDFMKNKSILGGEFNIEGIVIKNYNQFSKDGKVQMAKIVSDSFKEKHKVAWKNTAPQKGDILEILKATYRHENRWNKAIQHLKEQDKLTDTPKDIGALIKEVQSDIKKECEEEIKEKLFNWAWSYISRVAVKGFPEWYKNQITTNFMEKKDD